MSDQQPVETSKPNLVTKLGLRFQKLNLGGALAVAIFMASCIVAVAYYMYLQNPNKKYDLARPGEKDNQSLRVEDDEADTTSPATAAAAKQKVEYLNKEINALSGISKFESEDLTDQNIQLVPADQPSL
jgi:hypothetical protein